MPKIIETHKILPDGSIADYCTFVCGQLRVSDVEDPDLYLNVEIFKWQESPQGKYISEHAVDLKWERYIVYSSFHYVYNIIATVPSEICTAYFLKFPKHFL